MMNMSENIYYKSLDVFKRYLGTELYQECYT